MRAVRDRCVWSQRMTHRDLVPYLVEESAELIDAVESGSRDDLREELGDLLWQVLFHAEIAARDGEEPFGIDDVARGLTAKMVRRHPHVFGDAVATTPEEVLVHWNAAKAAEKRTRTSVLDGVSAHMPSLALAQKLLSRAARLPTSTPTPSTPQTAKEQREDEGTGDSRTLGAQLFSRGDGDRDGGADGPGTEAELGDALLHLVAMARSRGWDAERALRERLRLLEQEIRADEAGGGAA
ncbi:MazG family protein [Microbacterium sp. MC2]